MAINKMKNEIGEGRKKTTLGASFRNLKLLRNKETLLMDSIKRNISMIKQSGANDFHMN